MSFLLLLPFYKKKSIHTPVSTPENKNLMSIYAYSVAMDLGNSNSNTKSIGFIDFYRVYLQVNNDYIGAVYCIIFHKINSVAPYSHSKKCAAQYVLKLYPQSFAYSFFYSQLMLEACQVWAKKRKTVC